MELADHQGFTAGTRCTSRTPRAHGGAVSNENTFRLLRQYFPKGTSMGTLTQDDLNAVAAKLNTRPRKILGLTAPRSALPNCCVDPLSLPRRSSRKTNATVRDDRPVSDGVSAALDVSGPGGVARHTTPKLAIGVRANTEEFARHLHKPRDLTLPDTGV